MLNTKKALAILTVACGIALVVSSIHIERGNRKRIHELAKEQDIIDKSGYALFFNPFASLASKAVTEPAKGSLEEQKQSLLQDLKTAKTTTLILLFSGLALILAASLYLFITYRR